MAISRIGFNGHTSDEFHLALSYPFEFVHPESDTTNVSVPGVNGDVIQSNMRYKNFVQPVTFVLHRPFHSPSLQSIGREIRNWVAGDDYTPLTSDLIEGYEWEAHVAAAPTMAITNNFRAQVVIQFDCKPFLKRIEGQQFQSVPAQVNNTEHWSAEPLWHIKGTGNLTLTVNGLAYQLNGIDGEIYIDSERALVYKTLTDSRAGLAVFPNNDFPVLTPGNNTISLSGNYTEFEFKPNWRCLA